MWIRSVTLWCILASLTSCASFSEAAKRLSGKLKIKDAQNETNIEVELLPPDAPFDDGLMGSPPSDTVGK